MEESKTLEIEGIPVLFRRSRRARHISISVAPFYGVRVAVPCSLHFRPAIYPFQDRLDKETLDRAWAV